MYDRARVLAGNNPQLLQYIEQQQTDHLVANNDAEELAARGNAGAAVEMYAAQGNWDRAHELVGALEVAVHSPCAHCFCYPPADTAVTLATSSRSCKQVVIVYWICSSRMQQLLLRAIVPTLSAGCSSWSRSRLQCSSSACSSVVQATGLARGSCSAGTAWCKRKSSQL